MAEWSATRSFASIAAGVDAPMGDDVSAMVGAMAGLEASRVDIERESAVASKSVVEPGT